ncbi:MAG: EAL domain-containing protein [Rubrivivax sp.]
MSTLASEAILEREAFLETPALFRWGPLGIFLTWLSFLIAGIALAQWRIDEGREGEYAKAFAGAGDSAYALVHAIGRTQEQLARVAAHAGVLYRLSGDAGAVQQYLQGQFENAGAVPLAALFDLDGRAIASSAARLSALARPHARAADLGVPGLRWAEPVRMADGSTCVPLIRRVDGGAVAVFFVDLREVLRPVLVSLGPFGGWLHVELDGRAGVLDLVQERSGALSYGAPQRRRIDSVADALQRPTDYESQDLLLAWSRDGQPGMQAAVGVTMEAALAGTQRRFLATYLIIGVLAVLLGALSFVIGWAIRRFARKEAYLRQLAAIDALTGLPNRRSANALLQREFERARRSGERLALLYIDLDNFKAVNDSAGHTEGDALLKIVAARLHGFFDGRGLVFRLGGDEFMVILPAPGSDAAVRERAERMLERLHETTDVMGVHFRPRASVGAAAYPTHAASVEDLLKFADTAMYRAKDDGRHRVVMYSHALAQSALDKAALAQDLELALETDALHLVYQPKFDARHGGVTGFEALLRWDHPTRGAVSPGLFIPIAERTGVIVEVGNWVLRGVLRQLRDWHSARGIWQRVAVNVSAIQLRDAGWVHAVHDALHAIGVPAHCLQLELTESVLASDPVLARHVLGQLRRLGVSIAIDDFGTGYSSMASLQAFELDLLKLDRSFVLGIGTDAGREVCRAVISLGHALGLKVLAEGVETAQQHRVLAQLGCDEVQGYLFARPLAPALAIEQARADFGPQPCDAAAAVG